MPRRNSAAYYPSGSWPLKLASATAQRGRAEFLPSATTLSSRQVWVWPCLVLPCQEVMDAHGTALPPQGWAPAHVLCRQKTFCLWQCKLQNEAGLCHSPVWFGCQQSEKSSLEIAVLTTGRRFCVTVELIHFDFSLFLSFFCYLPFLMCVQELSTMWGITSCFTPPVCQCLCSCSERRFWFLSMIQGLSEGTKAAILSLVQLWT